MVFGKKMYNHVEIPNQLNINLNWTQVQFDCRF